MKNDRCPVCGKNLEWKRGSVIFPAKAKKVAVDNLRYQECVACHEKVFSQEAQEKIEKTVYGQKREHVA